MRLSGAHFGERLWMTGVSNWLSARRRLPSSLGSALVLASCFCSAHILAAEPEPAANDTARDPRLDNPSTYEFAFLSVGIEQAFSVLGRTLFVGGGGGLGPPLYRLSQMKCAGSSSTCAV